MTEKAEKFTKHPKWLFYVDKISCESTIIISIFVEIDKKKLFLLESRQKSYWWNCVEKFASVYQKKIIYWNNLYEQYIKWIFKDFIITCIENMNGMNGTIFKWKNISKFISF